MATDRHLARLRRMHEVLMAAFLIPGPPAIFPEGLNHIPNLHRFTSIVSDGADQQRIAVSGGTVGSTIWAQNGGEMAGTRFR